MDIDDDEVLFHIKKAVETITTDVEVGLLLSGGIDPNYCSKVCSKNTKTFSSVFFEDFKFDESEHIDKVTKKYEINTFKNHLKKSILKNLMSVLYRRGGIHPIYHSNATDC